MYRYTTDTGATWNTEVSMAVIGYFMNSGSIISTIAPYAPSNILKHSDKSVIAGWGLPSSRQISMTIGASGAAYTAPANGWFCFNASTNAGGYVDLDHSTKGYTIFGNSAGSYSRILMPVERGDVVYGYYANVISMGLTFYYAVGEV